MRLLFAAVSSAGCLIACSLLTSAQNIDTSFNVDGSCDDDQKAILNTMVTETMDLVDTARNGVQSFLDGKDGENPIEAQYLLTFFGAKRTPANKDATSVKVVLDAVHDYLTGGKGKGKLYCTSQWWEQKQPGDLYQDANGNTLPDDKAGRQTILRHYPKELKQGNGPTLYPYWSAEYHAYITGTDEEGRFYCDKPDNLAITIDRISKTAPPALTMCPSSFRLSPSDKISARTSTLGENRPTDGQNLQDLQSLSLTFLHEIIHVARTVERTTRKGSPSEYYGCAEALQAAAKAKSDALKNPDNYVFFTLGYWYWEKRTYDDNIKYKFVNCKAEPNTVEL